MKMSTRGRYGLRAMAEMARHYDGSTYLPLRSISRQQEIPEHYLERLLARLRQAGLVETQRGVQGGYRLSKPPQRITVYDILKGAGETLCIVECTGADVCLRSPDCQTQPFWERMERSLRAVASATTLAELAGRGQTEDPAP